MHCFYDSRASLTEVLVSIVRIAVKIHVFLFMLHKYYVTETLHSLGPHVWDGWSCRSAVSSCLSRPLRVVGALHAPDPSGKATRVVLRVLQLLTTFIYEIASRRSTDTFF